MPHARNDAGEKPRLTARPGDFPADLLDPDSSRHHDHDGGLRLGSAVNWSISALDVVVAVVRSQV